MALHIDEHVDETIVEDIKHQFERELAHSLDAERAEAHEETGALHGLQHLVHRLETMQPTEPLVPTTKTIAQAVEETIKACETSVQLMKDELQHRGSLKAYVTKLRYDPKDNFKNITLKNLDTVAIEGWLAWTEECLAAAKRMQANGAEHKLILEVLEQQCNYTGSVGHWGEDIPAFADFKESPFENRPVFYSADQAHDAMRDLIGQRFAVEADKKILAAKEVRVVVPMSFYDQTQMEVVKPSWWARNLEWVVIAAIAVGSVAAILGLYG